MQFFSSEATYSTEELAGVGISPTINKPLSRISFLAAPLNQILNAIKQQSNFPSSPPGQPANGVRANFDIVLQV